MRLLVDGLLYSDELNKFVYSNTYIINSGLNLETVSKLLGDYAEYISDDEKDILYARTLGIKIFNEYQKEFDYRLVEDVDLNLEIQKLKNLNRDFSNLIQEEYEFILRHTHNELLLKIAFLLKRHLDKKSNGVYLMRGSGVASYLLYAIGLNKVNPRKFGLDYKEFWIN